MSETYNTGEGRYNGGTGTNPKSRRGIVKLINHRDDNGFVTYECSICRKSYGNKHDARSCYMKHLYST